MSFLGEGTLLESGLSSKSLHVPMCRPAEGVHTLGRCTEGRVAQRVSRRFSPVGLAGTVKARAGLGLQGVEGIDGSHHEVQGGAQVWEGDLGGGG